MPKFRAKVLLASSYHLGDIPARTLAIVLINILQTCIIKSTTLVVVSTIGRENTSRAICPPLK